MTRTAKAPRNKLETIRKEADVGGNYHDRVVETRREGLRLTWQRSGVPGEKHG